MAIPFCFRISAPKFLLPPARFSLCVPQISDAGPNVDFEASPLEENLFEWHFTIRGPPGTAFEGGRYHGRITLPPEYPFKPPSIALLNKSGRFEVGKKICLSVSSHHPEQWQPAWGIRTLSRRSSPSSRRRSMGATASIIQMRNGACWPNRVASGSARAMRMDAALPEETAAQRREEGGRVVHTSPPPPE